MARFLIKLFIFLFIGYTFSHTCYASLATDTVYLTWQRDPSTTMTIQWITPTSQKHSDIFYRVKQQVTDQWQFASGKAINFPHSRRLCIHSVELVNLQADTEYNFQIKGEPESFAFRTAPADLSKPLCFVTGGDMYHDDISFMAQTCCQAALTNPSFAIIGGDIAYAVGGAYWSFFENNSRWLEWVKTWHANMITPAGCLIPVIAAIGNHDLIGQYNQSPRQAAVFSALFPMPGAQIYNALDFKNYLTFILLDSGHANPISGRQTAWLAQTLSTKSHFLHRFAVYHVPAYPSIRGFYNRHSQAIREHWVPLFENGKIQAVFEHHDHAFKRSYPLLRNQIDPQGIVYFGDGAWGVEHPRHPLFKTPRPYLAKFMSIRHFIAVTLNKEQQTFKTITDRGHLVDEYIIKVIASEPAF